MPFPLTAQLESVDQLPLEAFELSCSQFGVPHPELAGCKVRIRGKAPIYVIDRLGYRRLIPFPLTFMNLFQDAAVFQGVIVANSVAEIAEGPALDEGAVLLRGRSSELIYLLDQGRKRLITNALIMQKYDFAEESVVVVPQIVIDAIPEGDLWE